MITLSLSGNRIYLRLKGNHFYELLQTVKTIPGRQWNKESKKWHIPPESLRILIDEVEKIDGVKILGSEDFKIQFKHWKQYTKDIDDLKNVSKAELEKLLQDLKVKLMPHQLRAATWMFTIKKALCADEVGVGKTFAALGACFLIEKLLVLEKVLIVCPAGLKHQWMNEMKKLGIDDVLILEGTPVQRKKFYNQLKKYNILSYETLHRDYDLIEPRFWNAVILDEAQKIKNFKTFASKETIGLRSDYSFALTGTPIETNPWDLYNIFRFVKDDLLCSVKTFREWFVLEDYFGKPLGFKNYELLQKLTKHHLIRRKLDAVLDSVPEITESVIDIKLSKEERTHYKTISKRVLEILSRSEKDFSMNAEAIVEMTLLRQVCDSLELVDEESKTSSKLKELKDLLVQIFSSPRKVVIFSKFERMIHILERELDYKTFKIHGAISSKDRMKIISEFEKEERAILLTTDAMKWGCNLQMASFLINYDIPFNPATMIQRIGRLKRIGQKNKIKVYNLLCKNTLEEKIYKVMKERVDMFDKFFMEGKFRLTMENLKEMI